MDVEAVRAALSAPVLAPPIASVLGLPVAAVEAALALLSEGAQPAFVAAHRADRVDGLSVRDLERIQAAAVRAVAFEFQRETLRQELRDRHRALPVLVDMVRAAEHALDLEDVRVLLRKRKRGPAAKARGLGLGPLANALLRAGTTGPLSDPEILDLRRGPRAAAKSGGADKASRGASVDASSTAAPTADHDGVDASAAEGQAQRPEADDAAPHDDAAAGESPAGDDSGDHDSGDHDSGDHDSGDHESGDPDSGDRDSGDQDSGDHESAAQGSEAQGPEDEAHADAPDDADEPEAASAPVDPFAWAASKVQDAMPTVDDVLALARTICAERIAEWPPLRLALRHALLAEATITARVIEEKREKAARHARVADKPESCGKIASPTVLAIGRGEREGVLRVEIEVPDGVVERVGRQLLAIADGPAGEQVLAALAEAWQFSLGRAVRNGVRRALKERADRDAVAAYAEAIRPLLLAPAYGPVRVLGLDPGFAPGCRVAAIAEDATVLEHDTIFPLQPKLQAPQAKARLIELVTTHAIAAIAIADAGGGRELERLVREAMSADDATASLPIVMTDSETVAMLAASRSAKDELGEEAPLRRAVAVARRLQDPLAELVKVDPRKMALGQYQHEVDQEELRASLEQVVASCVCEVGVDVNRASPDVLAKVPGLSHAISRALLSFRAQHGGVATRSQLFDVPGFAGKTFEQSAGFLRIHGGEQPLDATAIHPERYPLVTQIARDLGVTVGDLLGHAELVDRIDADKYMGQPSVAGEPLGPRVMLGILDQLRHPGRDPRPPFEMVAFDPQLRSFADLTIGMELAGVVTRIANFGVFVDVGLSAEALVHVSELSHEFTASPADVVHIGQAVRGRVIEIDAERKRFSLSLRALQPKPERPERPQRPKRQDGDRGGKPQPQQEGRRDGRGSERRDDRGPAPERGRDRGRDRDRDRGPRPEGGRGDDRGRPRGPGRDRNDRGGDRDRGEKRDTTLNFNLDLSALLDRVAKD
jgi:uncharacterized protein